MRSTKNSCRICRREGQKLFLKGDRCFSPKCPIEKRGAVPPGVHGSRAVAKRMSDYGIHLREKQKAKRLYRVDERQFKRYVARAKKAKQETGQLLFQILESRLDNVVYRLGFAPGRRASRQLVAHGHVLVDGKKVDTASYQTKTGQVVSIRPKSTSIESIADMLEKKDLEIPDWLEKKGAAGKILRLPNKDEVGEDIDDRLVIEFYSR